MQNMREDRSTAREYPDLFGAMDRVFLSLRITVLFGGLGWLYFAPLSVHDKIQALFIFVFFSFYTAALYAAIFYHPENIRNFYLVGLLFDLLFIFLFLMLTGGAASSFFLGFYILVALHSFYYGLREGFLVSIASSLIYLVSYVKSGYPIHWTDFSIRIFFLFMLSVSSGLLTGMMKKDRERIGQLNQRLRESIESLEAAQQKLIETTRLAALGRMTLDVAHEIRNPLVTIGGFARRCNEKIDPSLPEKKYSEIVVDEVERLEKILRDLLTFSQGAPRRPKKISVKEAVDKGLEMLAEEVQEKQIRVVRDVAEDLPAVMGDEEQIQQVFMHIILNAVQAMDSDGVLTLRARPRVTKGREFLSVEIEDTGMGIPRENLSRIFDPFFSTRNAGEGAGLGLSVSRRIVEEHNGRIEVESVMGKGSKFTVLLPLLPEEEISAREREVRST